MRILSAVSILLLVAATAFVSPANAQNTYAGGNIYVTGDNPPLDGWAPSSRSDLQLLDDGTNGDATASDGIYSRTVTGLTGATRFQWKMANDGGYSVQFPAAGNSFAVVPASGTMTFYFDSRTRNDGFLPDNTGGANIGIVYTDPSAITSTGTIRVVGNFIHELGGTDWTTNDDHGLMYDDGTHGDAIASDGIYTFQATGLAVSGDNEFKIVANNSYDYQINTLGYCTSGGNIIFPVLDPSDVITIEANIANGTYRVTNSNPLSHAGPPFYATGVARTDHGLNNIPWSDQLSTATQMYDDGTHGDIAPGDGIYGRMFDGPSTPGLYLVQVRQGVGNSYPGSGQYPFETTSPNEPVLVQFDTNTYSDGAQPDTRFVWVNPSVRYLPPPDSPNTIYPYLQAVGDFMTSVGGATNWSNNDTLFQMFDDGAAGGHGDITSGDGVYAAQFTAVVDITNAQYKALAKQGSWDWQMGGTGDGYTAYGNNPAITFSATSGQNFITQVDTVTGRVKVDVAGSATPIERPATLNATTPITAARDSWSLYQ